MTSRPTPPEVTGLIDQIAAALNRLEALDINVQMPATYNGAGVRTDAGTLDFEHYDGPHSIAVITWNGSAWQVYSTTHAVSSGGAR